MALVCGGRTYVQKVSVTKKVSKNINRRKVSNDDGQNMKSVYHSKQNNRISLDNSRLLWDFGSSEPRAKGDHQFREKTGSLQHCNDRYQHILFCKTQRGYPGFYERSLERPSHTATLIFFCRLPGAATQSEHNLLYSMDLIRYVIENNEFLI